MIVSEICGKRTGAVIIAPAAEGGASANGARKAISPTIMRQCRFTEGKLSLRVKWDRLRSGHYPVPLFPGFLFPDKHFHS